MKILKYIFPLLILCGASYAQIVHEHRMSSINQAVTTISTDQRKLIVSNAQTLTANLTIPATLSLEIVEGGYIAKASTYTLTINGEFKGCDGCFSGFDTLDVKFGPGAVTEVQPEWWQKNTSPGRTDMTSAFNNAAASLRPEVSDTALAGGIVKLRSGRYKILGTVIGRPGVVFEGTGGLQYNYQNDSLAKNLTWVDHNPATGNTDCFVFGLSAWDTYGRNSGGGVKDLFISGTDSTRRCISFPSGVIKPVIENVHTMGGSVGLYFRYGIETNIRWCTFGTARDYGVYIGYVTAVSTTVSFWGCRIDGNGTTDTGLYVDGATTTKWWGGVIDECTNYMVRAGVLKEVSMSFIGVHFETAEAINYNIRIGEYSTADSKISLIDCLFLYTYGSVAATAYVAVAADYVSSISVISTFCGGGYVFSATANTGWVHIGTGTGWGTQFGSGVNAAATSAENIKTIGFSGTYTDGYGVSAHRAMHHADIVQSVDYGATITPDLRKGGIVEVDTLTGNPVIAAPTAGRFDVGSIITFSFIADGSNRTVQWTDATYKTEFAKGATYQEQVITATNRHTIRFYYNGSIWIQLGEVAVIVN